MPLPPLTDGQIDGESPLNEALMKEGIRDRDDFLWDDVEAVSQAFGTAGHSHDGTAGEGSKIDTAGIANGAASQNAMFTDNCVSAAKIATDGIHEGDFEDLAVTLAKFTGPLTHPVSGSHSYDSTNTTIDVGANWRGDRVTLPNPKGQPGVICQVAATASTYGGGSMRVDFWVVSQSGGSITLGFDYVSAGHDPAGTWGWSFSIL